MSRSLRRAVFVQGYGSPSKKLDKRMASKAVRRYPHHIPDGCAYKKISDSWDIADWAFDERWQDQHTTHLLDNYHISVINGVGHQNK